MASVQQHRIQRQVLEVSGCSRDNAQTLGQALRQLYLARLLPEIEAACDALAAPGELLRIDKLEIDLGALPWSSPEALRDTATERLAVALQSSLAQAAQATPAHQSAAELLAHFACTGTLPWWADMGDRLALSKAFDQLLAAPAAARALLRELADRADAWRRLLAHLGQRRSGDAGADTDARLDRLLLCLHPGWPTLAGARLAGLAASLAASLAAEALAPRADAAALARLRLRWWPPLLAAAGSGADPARLIGLALERLAQQSDIPAARLWQAWRTWRDGSAWTDPAHPAAASVAQALDARLLSHAAAGRSPASAPANPSIDPLTQRDADARLAALLRLWAGTPAGRALWGRLAGVLGQLPLALRRAAGSPGASAAGLADLAIAGRAQGLLSPEALQDWLQAVTSRTDESADESADDRADGSAHPHASAVAARLRAEPATRVQATPELADTLFVDNAGIVLLWPFLPNFFERLGLVAERVMVGNDQAQRAARLLHCLASGDPDPAEHQLPLCKLLCGLDLLAPIDVSLDNTAPLPEDQQAEAQALLEAVLAQASMLGGLSVDGLRGSFLLRRGQLSAVDGHHLLRVERESWDIVLARLPWSTSFVKLPWMATLLQVQW